MVEEWCGDSGGRLIPLPIIPLWDVEAAAKEVRRNAERGCTAVAFSEIPAKLGLPSIHTGYWEPFFRRVKTPTQLFACILGQVVKCQPHLLMLHRQLLQH